MVIASIALIVQPYKQLLRRTGSSVGLGINTGPERREDITEITLLSKCNSAVRARLQQKGCSRIGERKLTREGQPWIVTETNIVIL